ncbi:MAG: hypothetical protein WDZ32_01805 [Candidatus Saccharimonadales bacterium]
MAEIVPAVLASNGQEYGKYLDIATSLSSRIQIDLADDDFAPGKTVNLAQTYWPDDIRADIHLMYQHPIEHIPTVIAKFPNLLIVHWEANGLDRDNLISIADQLRSLDIKFGLALLPQTEVSEVAKVLEYLDHVLIFTGDLGHYGGDMQKDCLAKVGEVKNLDSNIEVGVDGGINDTNAAEVVTSGADVLNVGSFLQKADDPQKAYDKLKRNCPSSEAGD